MTTGDGTNQKTATQSLLELQLADCRQATESLAAERDRLRARVAELEAELAATERTLNAWIVRAKELEQTHAHPRRD